MGLQYSRLVRVSEISLSTSINFQKQLSITRSLFGNELSVHLLVLSSFFFLCKACLNWTAGILRAAFPVCGHLHIIPMGWCMAIQVWTKLSPSTNIPYQGARKCVDQILVMDGHDHKSNHWRVGRILYFGVLEKILRSIRGSVRLKSQSHVRTGTIDSDPTEHDVT